jgi:hypothetical protein
LLFPGSGAEQVRVSTDSWPAASGVGAGEALNGIVVSGGVAGSTNVTGLGIAGGYMRIEEVSLRGVSVSGFNDIRGTQRGLTIGLVRYA